ncbi:Heat induced stress protein YflT [Paenibacillus sp. UNCCL117]|uniref:general stress protein n=1 Tax=unclassified Paenibacillus TaxID=185978 RepID=UPI0008919678|nr:MULTISPECIES: general stress protein [unclassified Paenibacillus]SDE08235.1 Heat induced stress protein YflT [Paenibacillus sp. cl123]SFW59003.1 Heat induced stress protein YflT [Paenibacillus sp. UNCCL117]
MNTKIKLVDHTDQVVRAIREFRDEGHPLSEIYVLAHETDRTDELSKLTDANTIGMLEEGVGTAFANLFRSRGDQLRAKIESMGISAAEADRLEAELDKGKVLVLVWHDDDNHVRDEQEAALRRDRREETFVPPIGGVY